MQLVHTPTRTKAPIHPMIRNQANQSTNFQNLVFANTQYIQQSPNIGKSQKKTNSINYKQQQLEAESVYSQVSNIMQNKETDQIKQSQEKRNMIKVGLIPQQNCGSRIYPENKQNRQSFNCMKDLIEQNNNVKQQTVKPTNSQLMSNVLKNWNNENETQERFPAKEKKFYEIQQEKQVVLVQREITEQRPRFYQKIN